MLGADDLAARLAAAVARPAVTIDDRPGPAAVPPAALPGGPLTPAAVLVPVVAHARPSVLLTLRGRQLKAHAGQVSFPGGRIEPSDASPAAAAVREAEEEIGLAPRTVQVIGTLGEHVTGTGYRITPVVALVRPPLALRPDPAEVDEVFELPLAEVLDAGAFSWREEVLLGRRRQFWVVRHERHLIWGATAAMLVSLRQALGAPPMA
jgi:8-oxo-dGTP pyrophosphatase MutT (NUDIX family)